MTKADRIRGARERLEITQGELAKRCKVKRTTVCNWEAGLCLPSDPRRVATVLGLAVEDLVP